MDEKEKRSVVYDALMKINDEHGIKEKFEEQRRNIGKAYGVADKIREASKDGIYFLKKGDIQEVENCVNEIKGYWLDLIKMDLPKDIAWKHQAEAGQEMVEFIYVILLYRLVEKIDENPSFPSHEELMVSIPAWLSGVGDSVTELGKLMLKKLLNKKLTFEERAEILERYLDAYKQIYDYLETLENVYGMVINNSRRRGFGNSFRGVTLRISKFIERQERELVDIYRQKSGNERIETLLQSLNEKNR